MATQRCLYQLRSRSVNTAISRTFHHSQVYNQKEEGKEEGKSDEPSKKQTFSERFQSELDPEAKKQLEEAQNYFDAKINQFKSMLPELPELPARFKKVLPEKDPNEPPPPSSAEVFKNKVDAMKERFSKENVTKIKEQYAESYKLKSISIQEKVAEMKKKHKEEKAKKLEDAELAKENPVEKVSFTKRVETFAQERGFDNNPIYQKVKDATSETSSYVKDTIKDGKEQTTSILEKLKISQEVQDDLAKKSTEVLEEVERKREEMAKVTKEMAEKIQKEKDELTQSEGFQKAVDNTANTLKSVATELVDETKLRESENYRSPEVLQKRIEVDEEGEEVAKVEKKEIKEDNETTGVVFHKESMWEANWNNFRNNNATVNQFMDYKTKFEESDNIFLRATRTVTDAVTDTVRGITADSDISLTVKEVVKMDKTFNLDEFGTTLRFEIVPHVLEAYLRKDMVILKDWSHERAFGQFQHMVEARVHKGKIKLLDIGECDIKMGKMMEQGPVFIFSVTTQQLFTTHDKAGEVLEEQIKLITYMIATCRDQTMLDHRSAWLMLEIHEHVQSENFF